MENCNKLAAPRDGEKPTKRGPTNENLTNAQSSSKDCSFKAARKWQMNFSQ